MGCCLSTPNSPKPPKNPNFPKTIPRNNDISKSPPRTHTIMEEEAEETVKEVLSEIRTVPKSPPESPFVKKAPLLSTNPGEDRRNGDVCKKPYPAFAGADVSEDVGSEICSTVGECESVCTNPTEKSEGRGGESAEQLRQMSPAKRERTVGRSPGRRTDPSPGRARPGNGRRRDTGESSGRRSMSPVTRTNSGPLKAGPGRSPSARKMGKSPVRAGSGPGERARKLDRRSPPTNDESLENPLVSLECFIFL